MASLKVEICLKKTHTEHKYSVLSYRKSEQKQIAWHKTLLTETIIGIT